MKRILYVDDDPDLREIAVLALSLDADFEVRSCASGAEALELACAWRPHLVLLDVMMPEMDGPTTLIRLRGQMVTETPPVVFCTARAQAREVDGLRSLGAAGVITKPYDPMALAATVRGYLA